MTKIVSDNNTCIIHGKALSEEKAMTFLESKRYFNIDYSLHSWILRADEKHICSIKFCPLFKKYLSDKMWNICIKMMIYDECKKTLNKYFPDDVVFYILEKTFSKPKLAKV
jgi:hypothetical protein